MRGFEERCATIKATRLRYFVGGPSDAAEPGFLLIHGLGGAASNWVEIAPALAHSRRVLVPDLPGHGGSAPLAATPSLDPFADRVGLLAEREGLLRACVVGHSLGGVVALRLARRRPTQVAGLVLAAGAGISSTSARARYALRVLGVVKPGRRIAPHRRRVARSPLLRALVFGYWGASDVRSLSEEAVLGFLAGPELHIDTVSAARALVRDDQRVDLVDVACPVLVLWGADDNQLDVRDAFEYARRLRARVRVIADCGHLLIGERPEACVDAIEAFVSEL